MSHQAGWAGRPSMAKPDCHACRFFHVTWDERVPYECKAFGFRSSRLPALVVRETSGKHCTLFEPKARRPASES